MLRLRSELYALKGVLEDIRDMQANSGSDFKPIQSELLAVTSSYLSNLARRLELSKNKLGRAVESLRWPFEKDHQEVLAKLERLKSSFILSLMGDQRAAMDLTREDIRNLTNIVQDDVDERRAEAYDQKRQNLLKALAPFSPNVSHDTKCKIWRGTESGLWLLNGPFKEWIAGSPRIMWVAGTSGSGKSVLLSRVAEEASLYLPKKGDLNIAKFYCEYNNIASQEVRSVLGSWVEQLAHSVPSILENLTADSIKITDLEDRILKAASCSDMILLVLDALNESTERSEICQSIKRLTDEARNVRCVVSATPHINELHDAGCVYKRIYMTTEATRHDIKAYISLKTSDHIVLRCIPQDEIMGALLPRTEGMFRWVECQVQSLRHEPTEKLARRALKNLPGNLDDTYTAILLKIPQDDQPMIKEALMWLAFNKRPLTLAELNEAVVYEEGDEDIDDTCRLKARDLLPMHCQGLVKWDHYSDVVTLAHHSVRTFLTSSRIRESSAAFFHLDVDDCGRKITRKCLAYLSMTPFGCGGMADFSLSELYQNYHLLRYASIRWPDHAARVSLRTHELDVITHFFMTQKRMPAGGNFSFWISTLFPDWERKSWHASNNSGRILDAEPPYYCASFGMSNVLAMLLDKGLISADRGAVLDVSRDSPVWYIDHKCGRNTSSALQVASTRGHAEVVEMLLKAGADPESTDGRGNSCVDWAAVNRRDECVRLLLKYNASLDPARLSRLEAVLQRHDNQTFVPRNAARPPTKFQPGVKA